MLVDSINLKRGKTTNLALAAVLFHFSLFVACYLLLWITGLIDILPNDVNLVNWDAVWYQKIKDLGYQYKVGENNSMAFYPLFPLFWRLTGLGPGGISLINVAIFYSAFYLLARHFVLTIQEAFFYLTSPSLFFCFVPYTEALYFLGGVILLIGMDRQKTSNVVIGVLICGFSRSIAPILFIPVVYTTIIGARVSRSTAIKAFLICTLLFSITLFVYFIQYLQTGHWWVFFEAQKSWNRQFRIPTLPFTTLSGRNMLWLDGLALLVCIHAISLVLRNAYLWLRRSFTLVENRPSFLFSSCYLALTGVVGTFYSGNAGENLGTSLYSINRFVFASPFFIVFLHWVLTKENVRKYGNYLYFLLPLTWVLLGASTGYAEGGGFLKTTLYFTFMACFVLLYATVYKYRILYYFGCFANILLQLFLFNSFLHGRWVA